jgi:hypothetical protein
VYSSKQEEKFMAETRKAKKKKKSLLDFELLPVVRLIFLLSLAVFFVYLYYLHTKGILLTTLDVFWKKHQRITEMILGIGGYTGFIYYLGYRKGKKK